MPMRLSHHVYFKFYRRHLSLDNLQPQMMSHPLFIPILTLRLRCFDHFEQLKGKKRVWLLGELLNSVRSSSIDLRIIASFKRNSSSLTGWNFVEIGDFVRTSIGWELGPDRSFVVCSINVGVTDFEFEFIVGSSNDLGFSVENVDFDRAAELLGKLFMKREGGLGRLRRWRSGNVEKWDLPCQRQLFWLHLRLRRLMRDRFF